MKQHNYYVYIMTNKSNTVLYTGVCNDMARRVWEHKNRVSKNSFVSRYNINKLVYFEYYEEINYAVKREKQIKGGSRAKKIALIEKENKEWRDLSLSWDN